MIDWRSEVLKYWFGLEPQKWWNSDADVDAEVKSRFLKTWAAKRELPASCFIEDPLTALASVVLFDQFPRNMFRGHADQYSTDHLALQIAREAVERGFDDQLEKDERTFLYMPFQHSEDMADQRQAMVLFTAMGDDYLLGFAKKHHDVVARFGRFPHRNAILGRASGGRARGRRCKTLVMMLVETARTIFADD